MIGHLTYDENDRNESFVVTYINQHALNIPYIYSQEWVFSGLITCVL